MKSRKRRKRILLTTLLAAAAILFAGLGLWQVERRAEKLALIAAVTDRLRRAPVPAPAPAQWSRISFESNAYRRLRIEGEFLHDRETPIQASTERGPGYWVLTPLRTEAGWTVLVNRGFVPPEDRRRAARAGAEPRGQVDITGLLRLSEPGGGFLHANDPASDRWYSRDLEAIGRARRLGALAPYYIDADAGAGRPGPPVGGLTNVTFANNQLQYALTWFALAGLAAFGVIRIRRN
jgi:surfeit locus 1 family protein